LSHLQLERGETPGSAGARFQQSRLRTLSFQARMSGQQLKGAAMWCKPIRKVRDMADQIKSHMLAAVVPAKGERWQLQEVPVPELLPTQVLVKVCASGISYADVEQTRGELPGHFPRILGHEVAGDVVAVGDAVTADDCILTWSGTLRRHDARQ
jgi:Alcohol dehydrogenase GroES-like domain